MAFGNIFGSLYLHGLLVVATPGTPVSFSQNFPTNITGIGTVQMNANQIILKAPSTNQGTVYLVFRGGNKNLPNSVIVDLVPGQAITLGTSAGNSPYRPFDLMIDADVPNDACRATSVIAA